VETDIPQSYTAAANFPLKLFVHEEVIRLTKKGFIPPIHVQLCPTNKCNRNCFYCSCSARDKTLELSFHRICQIMDVFRVLGCRAVTITGGGEPLLHPDIQKIIPYIAKYLGIEVGLVTNGMLLNKFSPQLWDNVLWCRISNDDSRPLTQEYIKVLEEGLEMGPRVDWAFSHVVSKELNMDVISDVVEFANRHKFTHVRLVSDLFDLEHVPSMQIIRDELKKRKVDDKLVVYQDRKSYERGTSKCFISLLKPTVCPDGNLYPCCGTQYAMKNSPSRDFMDEDGKMVMGKATPAEIGEIWRTCHPFDGSVCDVCYYGEYNRSLVLMLKKIQHPNHV